MQYLGEWHAQYLWIPAAILYEFREDKKRTIKSCDFLPFTVPLFLLYCDKEEDIFYRKQNYAGMVPTISINYFNNITLILSTCFKLSSKHDLDNHHENNHLTVLQGSCFWTLNTWNHWKESFWEEKNSNCMCMLKIHV